MSKNKITEFDQLIKDSVNGFEAPYDANAWNSVESKLKARKESFISSSAFKIAVALTSAAAVLIFSFAFFQSKENNTKKSSIVELKNQPNNKVTEEKTVELIPIKEQQVEKETAVVEIEQNLKNQEAPKKEISPLKEEKIIPILEKNSNQETENDISNLVKTKSEEVNNSIDILASKIEVCVNEIFTLKPSDSIAVSSLAWDFGDGNSAKRFNAKHRFKEEGNYFVTLTIVDINNNLIKTEKQIVVNPKPKADFDYETTDFQCHNSSICFQSYEPNLNFKWNFGDSKISNEENPKHTYFRKGHYNVKLTVENEFGCADSIQKQVYVMRAYNLLAPNAFSPNGDGQNDTWIPIALMNSDKAFNLKIVDANGIVVFTTNNSNNTWDGTILNGSRANSGDIFFWIATVKEESGDLNEYGGSIVVSN